MNFLPGDITRAYGPTWLPDASEQIFNIGRQDRRSPCVMPADAIASECTELRLLINVMWTLACSRLFENA